MSGGFERIKSVPTISGLELASILESELERLFIARLATWAQDNKAGWKELERERWQLTLGSQTWRVEPQVELDEGHDVAVKCRPDFVFWPEQSSEDVFPVAVFLDGFTFHGMWLPTLMW